MKDCVLQKTKHKAFTRIDCMFYHIFQRTKHETSKGINIGLITFCKEKTQIKLQ
jgi:hypothetical protein